MKTLVQSAPRLFNDPIGRSGLENHVATSITREPLMADTRVTRVLNKFGALAFPGVFDTLSARIAERVGFPMAFVSGYSVAATTIGEPDMGLLTQTEMIDRARRICMSVKIPIIVDADTGYGNPLNVHRTVHELIAAGAAGCFLEDQVWPKKCGHMRGKKVIGRDDYVQKIRAAVDAPADAISSSSRGRTPWPPLAWTRQSAGLRPLARPGPTPASWRRQRR